MIPIELLRVRIGLDADDTTQDLQLELADMLAISMLETWLDRKLAYGADVETFVHWRDNPISLRRYPIDADSIILSSVDALGFPSVAWHADRSLGLLFLDGRACSHEFSVAYSGGFVELPPDLLVVALLVFDSVWTVLAAGSSSAQTAVGSIKSISIPDVGTIQYATSSDGSSTVTGATSDYGIPALYTGIVDRHRRIYA